MEKLGRLNILRASQFKRYIVHIKRAYRCTFQRQQSGMKEAVSIFKILSGMDNHTLSGEGVTSPEKARAGSRITYSGPIFVRDEVRTMFEKLQNAVRGDLLVKSGKISMGTMNVFKNDAMQAFLRLIVGHEGQGGRKYFVRKQCWDLHTLDM